MKKKQGTFRGPRLQDHKLRGPVGKTNLVQKKAYFHGLLGSLWEPGEVGSISDYIRQGWGELVWGFKAALEGKPGGDAPGRRKKKIDRKTVKKGQAPSKKNSVRRGAKRAPKKFPRVILRLPRAQQN